MHSHVVDLDPIVDPPQALQCAARWEPKTVSSQQGSLWAMTRWMHPPRKAPLKLHRTRSTGGTATPARHDEPPPKPAKRVANI